AFFWSKLLENWMPFREGNVSRDLSSERSMADGFQAALEGLEDLLLTKIGELFPEALEVAKGVLVDETHQTEKFEERVLERRCREKKRRHVFERLLERVGDDVRGLIDIAQAVC